MVELALEVASAPIVKVASSTKGTTASSTKIAAAEVITPSFGIAFTLPFAQFIAGQTTGCCSQATGCPGIHAPLRWRTVPLVRRTIGTIALIGFLVKRWSASERRRTHAE